MAAPETKRTAQAFDVRWRDIPDGGSPVDAAHYEVLDGADESPSDSQAAEQGRQNKGYAVFTGSIPGPDNAEVLLVLQVKSGTEWRVFRRYRTHEGGHFLMRYRFTQTFTPTTYIMRAQLRKQSGYPYEEGNSREIPVTVKP